MKKMLIIMGLLGVGVYWIAKKVGSISPIDVFAFIFITISLIFITNLYIYQKNVTQ